MKTYLLYMRFLLLLIAGIAGTATLNAQIMAADSQRVGATGLLCLQCVVNNPSRAADANLQSFSELRVNVGLGAQTYQELIYPSVLPANTRTIVKFGTGDNLISLQLLGAIYIQPFNGTTPAGAQVTAASLLTVLSNNNQELLPITPAQPYDRIRVTLDGGVVGVLNSIYLYEAYHLGNNPALCTKAFDELHGISSGLLGLGLGVGGVQNPLQAIDGNPATASTLNAGVAAVGAFAQQTAVFQTPAKGDSVRITFSIPQTIIDLGVLGSISVSTYKDNTFNNDARFINSALVRLRLLDLTAGRRRVAVSFLPQDTFNRVQVRLNGGIASLLSTIDIYEISRSGPAPVVTMGTDTITNGVSICSGAQAVFNITPQPGVVYNWYTQPTGGSVLYTGPSYTTPPLFANMTYYAEAVRSECTDGSDRAVVMVNIKALPAVPVPAASTLMVASGNAATVSVSPVQPGVTYRWYDAPTAGNLVFTGPVFVTGMLTRDTAFYVEAVSDSCASATRASVTIQVRSVPDISVNPLEERINAGQTASFTATSGAPDVIFNWYTDPSGGSPIYTGSTFPTSPLFTTTIFYVEALDTVTNKSSVRISATVIVEDMPDILVTPAVRSINAGQTASFTASSTNTGVIFNWYTTPAGGSPIYTGITFTSPAVYGNTTYYVEALDVSSNAISVRLSARVMINGAPVVTIVPPVRTVNAGQTTSFTAMSSSPGLVFYWYTQAQGGSPVFMGPSFTTPPVYGSVMFYAQAVDTATGAVSERVPATIVVNGLPSIIIVPKVRNINPGQTATFSATSPTPGAVIHWYTDSVSNAPVFTGPVFTSMALYSNTTFYATATDPVGGGISARGMVAVTVNTMPDVVVVPPVQTIDPGKTASFTALSTTPGAVFSWYADPQGGSPIFTGPVFTTPQLYTNTTFYVEARNPNSNAVSHRVMASVTVRSIPFVTVIPPVRTINAGQTTSFRAEASTPGVFFEWFVSATAEAPVYTGDTFTTPPLNANTVYYVHGVDPSTGAISPRMTASVMINDAPDVTVTPPVRTISAGQSTSFSASSSTVGATFRWYTVATGGTPVFTGDTFTTPAVFTNTTYYVEAVAPGTNALSARGTGSVVITGSPDVMVTPPVRMIRPGQSASFTASSTTAGATFRWYTVATGGVPAFTGPVFTTPQLNASTVYYVEAVAPGTNAVSSRATGSVIVDETPDITVTPPVRTIQPGQTTSFTASSTTPGATFRWYTVPTGGTPIFTGATFTTPQLNIGTVYYAEAVAPVSNVVSSRASATVVLNQGLDITVTPPVRTISAGQYTSFTASSTAPGVIFRWYNASGAQIYTGAMFTTPILNTGTIYYVEAADTQNNALSVRATATVVINQDDPLIFIPTAFTPNGDGNNDELAVLGATISDFDMRIFNQWGQEIFTSNDPSKSWDGRFRGENQPVGVYVYYLKGKTGDAHEIDKQGTILLIR
jgi:gliding motility-associated-like protein